MDFKAFVEQYTGHKLERWQIEVLKVLESGEPFILYGRDPNKYYRQELSWALSLAKMRACWMKGETTAYFSPNGSSLKEKPVVIFDEFVF